MQWLKYAGIVSLVVLAFALGAMAIPAEAEEIIGGEVVITYHPEVNIICASNGVGLRCSSWWELVEPWMREGNPNELRARLFGEMN